MMTTTTTMLAATQDRYGDADVLAVRAVPRPVVGDGEVLISVRAAGCGPDVMHVMTGKPYFARTMLGFTKPKQTVAGRDVAGVVVAVGDGVEGFAVGDEVYGTATSGSFAEYAVAPATQLAHKPAALSFVEAGGVPVSGGTALQAPPHVVELVAHLLPAQVKWKVFFDKQEKNPKYLNPGDRITATIRTADGAIDLGTQDCRVVGP